MQPDLEAVTRFALGLIEGVDAAILPHFRTAAAIDNKRAEDWDPVTEGDRAAERHIRRAIEKSWPDHGIIGEEYGEKPARSSFTWILDPIDGTRGFVSGLPTWGCLVALYRDGAPWFGLMHQPFVQETFYGSEQGGAYLANRFGTRPLKVAAPKPLSAARAGTTSPHLYKESIGFERLRQSVQLMRYGCDCYSFAMLAAGCFDIALDPGTQIYDVAALIPIMRGAGAHVANWDGTDDSKGGNILAASCKALFDAAQEALVGR